MRKWVPDILAALGAVCIACGVFLWSIPAGFIASGLLLVAGAIVWSKGGGDNDS